MMDENRFAHDKSQYERPNFPYRCGRSVLWKKPCYQGPNLDGSCGGVSECVPIKKGSNWECKRPKSVGGVCADGPTPQGECCFKRSPCSPKPTLRVYRGRVALLVALLIVAVIGGAQAFYPINNKFFKSSDLKPISRVHQKFSQEAGCATCHTVHNAGPGEWVKAIFTKNDLSDKCVNCHNFAGPDFKAHNGGVKKEGVKKDHEYQDTQCQMCHQEHKGEISNTKRLTGKQCNFCHKAKFESFSRGHPEFRENYPYIKRNSINFNHVTHFNKWFEKSKGKGPQTCTGCHNVNSADRAVRSYGFDVVCAECHANNITKKSLNLINLPDMTPPESEEFQIDRQKVLKSCSKFLWNEMEMLDETRGEIEIEKFEKEINKREVDEGPVSQDSLTVVSAYLLNIEDGESSEAYGRSMQKLLLDMAQTGTVRVAEMIEEHSGDGMAKKLLAGLHPEIIKRAACAWALNQEYEPPVEAKYGGWFTDSMVVNYTPLGHADAVAKSWIEFALAATAKAQDEKQRELALAMRDEILDPKYGVGGCLKCHALTAKKSAKGKEKLFVEWKITWPELNPFVFYSHKNHINIMGANESCKNCHVIDNKANYKIAFKNNNHDPEKYVSNFSAIERNQCVNCHSENQVTQECQTCHIYHLKPGFKKSMIAVVQTQSSLNN